MDSRDLPAIRELQLSALTKKGLRRWVGPKACRPHLQLSALTKKGLRLRQTKQRRPGVSASALCPDEEGIKTYFWINCRASSSSALCPDEEGIKTRRRPQNPTDGHASALCPDEEGIKTPGAHRASRCSGLQLSALTKKGLRQRTPRGVTLRGASFSSLP